MALRGLPGYFRSLNNSNFSLTPVNAIGDGNKYFGRQCCGDFPI